MCKSIYMWECCAGVYAGMDGVCVCVCVCVCWCRCSCLWRLICISTRCGLDYRYWYYCFVCMLFVLLCLFLKMSRIALFYWKCKIKITPKKNLFFEIKKIILMPKLTGNPPLEAEARAKRHPILRLRRAFTGPTDSRPSTEPTGSSSRLFIGLRIDYCILFPRSTVASEGESHWNTDGLGALIDRYRNCSYIQDAIKMGYLWELKQPSMSISEKKMDLKRKIHGGAQCHTHVSNCSRCMQDH